MCVCGYVCVILFHVIEEENRDFNKDKIIN